ncbi:hypothetical protein [sulfur-oxidizing endosymbiont of Gigantopelta aegis]|uniref:hypothetical protein n=1 Tax=sulfur-oxidizing endosymbiont of Gigantopelta aegis TaxID=2794934 RepID=UPI0018DDF9BB|nr:hypothetical protein [sulfur-oxidizing endosymbiont of Gigantopelta aegis]
MAAVAANLNSTTMLYNVSKKQVEADASTASYLLNNYYDEFKQPSVISDFNKSTTSEFMQIRSSLEQYYSEFSIQ